MSEYKYELWQDGMCVAAVYAPSDERARAEINHYALIYGQDGPVEIRRKAEGKR